MRKSLTRLALAGAAVSVLAAGAALAQIPAPPPPPAPPAPPEAPPPPLPPMAMMAPGMDMGFMRQHFRAPDPEKRAQRLRDVLQLRPDQDRVLKAYVEATTPKMEIRKQEVVKDKSDKPDGDKAEWTEPAPPTTLERLDRMTKAADAMKQRAEATRAFYLALSPSQQKTFDVLGMGDDMGGDHVVIRRLETRGAPMFKGDRKVTTLRKVG